MSRQAVDHGLERTELLPELDVALVVPVLTLFQALLVVDVSAGSKLEAGLHLLRRPIRTALDAVLQLAQEGNDLPVLLRVLVDLSSQQLVLVTSFARACCAANFCPSR
jgi:hypothetical protein